MECPRQLCGALNGSHGYLHTGYLRLALLCACFSCATACERSSLPARPPLPVNAPPCLLGSRFSAVTHHPFPPMSVYWSTRLAAMVTQRWGGGAHCKQLGQSGVCACHQYPPPSCFHLVSQLSVPRPAYSLTALQL